jgi:hypothetical protein
MLCNQDNVATMVYIDVGYIVITLCGFADVEALCLQLVCLIQVA